MCGCAWTVLHSYGQVVVSKRGSGADRLQASMRPRPLSGDDSAAKWLSGGLFLTSFEMQQRKFVSRSVSGRPEGAGVYLPERFY